MGFIVATAFVGMTSYGSVAPTRVLPAGAYAQIMDGEPAIRSDPTPPLPAVDRRFLTELALDNLTAMASLQLLAERSSAAALREFARCALHDRGVVQVALEVLAIRKDVFLPRRATSQAGAGLTQLRALSGKAFDQEWRRRYSQLGQRTAARMALAQRQARDADVRTFATTQSAVVRGHVEQIGRAAPVASCPATETTAR